MRNRQCPRCKRPKLGQVHTLLDNEVQVCGWCGHIVTMAKPQPDPEPEHKPEDPEIDTIEMS